MNNTFQLTPQLLELHTNASWSVFMSSKNTRDDKNVNLRHRMIEHDCEKPSQKYSCIFLVHNNCFSTIDLIPYSYIKTPSRDVYACNQSCFSLLLHFYYRGNMKTVERIMATKYKRKKILSRMAASVLHLAVASAYLRPFLSYDLGDLDPLLPFKHSIYIPFSFVSSYDSVSETMNDFTQKILAMKSRRF